MTREIIADGTAPVNPNKSADSFLYHSRAMFENGWRVSPLYPGSKIPGIYRRGEWQKMPRWADHATSQSVYKVEAFQRMVESSETPGVGLCTLITPDLVWVDLDSTDTNVRDDLIGELQELDGAILMRVGSKGFAMPFRLADGLEVPNAIHLDGHKALELLQYGKQVVCYGVHPDTGRPYEWLTDAQPWNTRTDELPVFDEDVLAICGDVLRFYGSTRTPVAHRTRREGDIEGDYHYARLADKLDTWALDNIGEWIHGLPIHAVAKRSGGYDCLATWRPSEKPLAQRLREPNLGVHRNGISDFGDNARGYTPIGLVAVALGVDYESALWWLYEAKHGPWPDLHPDLRGRG